MKRHGRQERLGPPGPGGGGEDAAERGQRLRKEGQLCQGRRPGSEASREPSGGGGLVGKEVLPGLVESEAWSSVRVREGKGGVQSLCRVGYVVMAARRDGQPAGQPQRAVSGDQRARNHRTEAGD